MCCLKFFQTVGFLSHCLSETCSDGEEPRDCDQHHHAEQSINQASFHFFFRLTAHNKLPMMLVPNLLEFWAHPMLWTDDSDNIKFWVGNLDTYCPIVRYAVYQAQEVTQELFLKRRIMLLEI